MVNYSNAPYTKRFFNLSKFYFYDFTVSQLFTSDLSQSYKKIISIKDAVFFLKSLEPSRLLYFLTTYQLQ